MTLTPLRISTALALAAFAVGCTSSPNAPSAISATWPAPLSPAEGAEVAYASQPVQLVVNNAVTTGTAANTYTFEVATDTDFTNIVYTKSDVPEGAGGQTALAVDKLAGAKTYYWRSHATNGIEAGPFSKPRLLMVGPEVILQIPIAAAPSEGGTTFSPVLLTVNNVGRSGPAGTISYRFDVADSAAFNNILFTGTAIEQPGGQTSITVTTSLAEGGSYFWRAQAMDEANKVVTPYSDVHSFTVRSFNMYDATMWDSPPDLASWPETAKITSINFTGAAMEVDFDKRDGPGRWPDTICCGFDGPIEYTLGMCLNINSHWNCSTVVLFWYGRSLGDSSPPANFYFEWWYDPGRWGPMTGYDPAEGELVGVFVASGNLRLGGSITRATCPRVCERSNVALVPFTRGFASYLF
jgi:hypothetical protein